MIKNENVSVSSAQPVSFSIWLEKCGDDKKKEAVFNLTGYAKVLLKMAMEKKYGTTRI